ncbi:ATP-binding protein, partial [Bhargavaea massiliensis]
NYFIIIFVYLYMNPCPCGYFGSKKRYCICSPKQIHAYRQRISGPIYDRIDILLSLEAVDLRTVPGTVR